MAVDGIPPQNGSAKLTNSTNSSDKLDKRDKHGELTSLDDAAGTLDYSRSEEVVAIVPNGITPGQKGPEVLILPADDPSTPGNTVHPSYPASNLELPDHHIDEVRSLRVTVIGAGLAGILAGILLPAKVPNIQLTILEKNTDVSGTWLENIYPGVRCDIPAHVYQSTFSPNTQWSQQFAEGHEIRDYWQAQARKYDVYKYVKFSRKVKDIAWDEQKAEWTITGTDLGKEGTGQPFEEKADFVLTAIGRFNDWRLPKYDGVSEFEGHLRHASNWDKNFDPTGKRVAIIGNGASGIQLVPNLQRVAKHIDHYARNKTWIAASWAGDERTFEPQWYSEEQKKSLLDPDEYLKFRKENEAKYWRRFAATFRGAPENEAMRERFIKIMTERVSRKPDLIKTLVPDFNPNCRRLTPGPGYLEAITADNVSFIQDPIRRFTKTGIETVTGEHREVDAIICATGAAIDFVTPFSVRAHGKNLQDVWRPRPAEELAKNPDYHGWPYTYLGLAVPDFPNLLLVHGPHGAGPSGTVPHSVEVQLTYYAKLLRKVSSQGIKTVSPSKKATDDFVAYADAFFPKTVLTDNCSSWANGGAPGQRIHGVWPGSAGHVTLVRKEPRWEDWEYEYWHDSGNRFVGWLGNGWTKKEREEDSDIVPYLRREGEVDLKSLHEEWWSWP